MAVRNYFEEEVSKLMSIINKMVENKRQQGNDPDEWLRTLYTNYANRFLSDNKRIWTTGSIFIPLSLAGFAALVSIKNPTWVHVIILMFVSITLLSIWLVIAENHRAFQQKSEAWLVAIERLLKLEGTGGPKVKGNFLNRLLTRKRAVQKMRWYLLTTVIIAWIFALLMICNGFL